MSLIARLHPEVRTQRGLLDVAYRTRALSVVISDAAFAWLADAAALRRGNSAAWKPKVLTELGKLPSDEAVRAVATILCEEKPEPAEAARLVKFYAAVLRNEGANE